MATLQFRSSDKFHDEVVRGPNPILTVEEEDRLKKSIISCQAKRFPLRIEDFQAPVSNFLDSNPPARLRPLDGTYKLEDIPIVIVDNINLSDYPGDVYMEGQLVDAYEMPEEQRNYTSKIKRPNSRTKE
ncbi:hypothetical protein HHI36_017891 [Cryptolaemus montrouzieri]|uniref:Uncharacterized protein n=1 Tax=Cryptolaemus montrouzieri TaxID=559131 RepID=A0ABD2NP77_9CUCU